MSRRPPFLKKLGVTYPQYLVLVALWERGSQGVGDLTCTLDLGTLSPMLKRIEKKGLGVGVIRPTSGGFLFPSFRRARRFASGHSKCWVNSTAS